MVSCKCITYGRVEFLEESLHSFLIQDWEDKEMVIVNDYPKQKLIFDHPQVKIHNLDRTFLTIGDKENYAASLCQGDIICQWDDDDVATSNHLQNVSEALKDKDLVHWQKGVFFNGGSITDIGWIGNSGIAYRKAVLEEIGGYPIENAGYDMTFIERIHALGKDRFIFASPKDPSWFYMWGGRGYHMSGQGHDRENFPNVIERHSAHIESLRRKGKIPEGNVLLKPHWKQDYQKLLDEYRKAP